MGKGHDRHTLSTKISPRQLCTPSASQKPQTCRIRDVRMFSPSKRRILFIRSGRIDDIGVWNGSGLKTESSTDKHNAYAHPTHVHVGPREAHEDAITLLDMNSRKSIPLFDHRISHSFPKNTRCLQNNNGLRRKPRGGKYELGPT